MLGEAVASVLGQSLLPYEYKVMTDQKHIGEAAMRNKLLEAASTEWVAFLDDDDLMLPWHLEVLWNSRDGADIIHSDCLVEGLEKHWQPRPYNLEEIRKKNYISITVLAKRSTLLNAGGFRPVRYPDWDMWVRLGEAGARFAFVPKTTWIYRVRGDNLILKDDQHHHADTRLALSR